MTLLNASVPNFFSENSSTCAVYKIASKSTVEGSGCWSFFVISCLDIIYLLWFVTKAPATQGLIVA